MHIRVAPLEPITVRTVSMEVSMSAGEIGILVFIISLFLTFAVMLAWASRRGG